MPRRLSEQATRKQLIDTSTSSVQHLQLEKAGWYLRDLTKSINAQLHVNTLREPHKG